MVRVQGAMVAGLHKGTFQRILILAGSPLFRERKVWRLELTIASARIYAASIPFTQRSSIASFFPLSLRRALSGTDCLFTCCGAGVAVYLLYRSFSGSDSGCWMLVQCSSIVPLLVRASDGASAESDWWAWVEILLLQLMLKCHS